MSWLRRAARIGYAAKGVTYILIAALAFQAAVGAGSAESTHGALRSLDGETSGQIVLLAIAVGLASYAFWKFYIFTANPERDGWLKRMTALFVAFTNGGFAVEALTLSLSLGMSANQTDPTVHWSARVMSHPLGAAAVGISGVFVAFYGIGQLVRALRRKVDEHLRRISVSSHRKRWIITACKFGIAARGVVFLLVGWFLVRAALQADPSEAKDFGRSLNEFRQQPMGRSLLCIVAVGLLLYAIYQLLRSRYERFSA